MVLLLHWIPSSGLLANTAVFTAIHFSVFQTALISTLFWLERYNVRRCLVHSGCCCRTSRAGRGSLAAGGQFSEPGPVCVVRGGSSHQGPPDPDRQVLGGAKGECPAAWRTTGGKLLSPPEVQNEPRGGKWSNWKPQSCHRRRGDINMELVLTLIPWQVQASLSELQTKLEQPIKTCSSSPETFKALQTHMVCSRNVLLYIYLIHPYAAPCVWSSCDSLL